MLCLYGLSSGDQDKNDSGDLETLSSFFVMNFVGFSVCVDLNQEQEAVVHSAASLSDSLFQMLSSTQTTLIIITALPGLALQRLAASGGWLALQTAVSSGEEGSAHETQQQLSVRGSADELFLDWSWRGETSVLLEAEKKKTKEEEDSHDVTHRSGWHWNSKICPVIDKSLLRGALEGWRRGKDI